MTIFQLSPLIYTEENTFVDGKVFREMTSTCRKDVFESLQPHCVKLIKDPTRDNLFALRDALKRVDKSFIQELQEYVLFPFRVLLKSNPTNGRNQVVYTDLFECLHYIFYQTRLTDWELFYDFLNIFCIHLDGSIQTRNKSLLTEEFQESAILCLTELIKNVDVDLIKRLFSVSFLPALGHSVSVLLTQAERQKSKKLKLLSIDCLSILTCPRKNFDSFEHYQFIKTLMSFLPGISIALTKIITGDDKQGTAVIVSAVQAWRNIIGPVMNDDIELEDTNKSNVQGGDERLAKLVISRTREWLQGTAEKLHILVKQIIQRKSHSHWRVRLALVEWAENFLLNCYKSMSCCTPCFLDVLVCLFGDEYSEVSSESRRVLHQLCQKDSELGRKLVEDFLEENLLIMASSLPRQIRMQDEEEKFSTVSLFLGYLTILGTRINKIFLSRTHMRKFVICLVQTLEMDCSDIKTLERRADKPYQISTEEQGGRHSYSKPSKSFQYFHDARTEKAFLKICRIIGCYGNLNIFIDQFMELFLESSTYKLQSVLIMNEIIKGVVTPLNTVLPLSDNIECASPKPNTLGLHVNDSQIIKSTSHENNTNSEFGGSVSNQTRSEIHDIIGMLIDEYLCEKNLNLHVNTVSDLLSFQNDNKYETFLTCSKESSVPVYVDQSPSLSQMNRNVTQICLILEGLGIFSKVLGNPFKAYLMKVLYPLLVKLGDRNMYISRTAYASIQDICVNCGYSSISSLIENNADYLMNSISLSLRHFLNNKTTPLVLKVIVEYCNYDILPVIEDIIEDILLSFDEHYTEEATLFLGVLYQLTLSIKRWFPSNKTKKEEKTVIDTTLDSKSSDFWNKGFLSDTVLNSSHVEERDKKVTLEEIENYFTNYHKQKQIADGNVTDIPDNNCDFSQYVEDNSKITDDEETEKEKKSPKHVEILKDLMKRTKHMLSSSNPRIRLISLNILSVSCEVLTDYQNELLPLIHQVWIPFTNRFHDEEKIVIIRAIETLVTVSRCCEDFISSCLMSDVLPKLNHFLVEQGKMSVQSGTSYQYTSSFRLQKSILENIGVVTCYTGLNGSEIAKIVDACSMYLSTRQPKQLQKACMDMLAVLTRLEPDVVWLRLNDLYCPNEYLPPTSCFEPVSFSCKPRKENEFTDNVRELLSQNL